MIPRYAPPQIAKIFSDASRLQRWLDVELLACEGWAEIGRIPVEALSTLQGASIDADRIAELEAEQGHDVAAFVAAVQETVGEAGRYFHLGLTSSDVVDTALATQLRDAAGVIDADIESLIGALVEQAERHRLTVMMGRTHGVHAEPLTLGIKLANFVDEVRRARTRFAAATTEIAAGQITGAVGTHASVPPEVEQHVTMNQFKQVAFSTPPGKVSPFQETTDGAMILYVKSKLPLDLERMNASLPSFINYVRQSRQNEAFNEWFGKQATMGLRDTPLGQPRPAPTLTPGTKSKKT